MTAKRPLIISGEGYVLLDRHELSRLLAIESRARHKLAQLKAATEEVGKERRAAHVEALEFTLGTTFGLEPVAGVEVPENVSKAESEGLDTSTGLQMARIDLLETSNDSPVEGK